MILADEQKRIRKQKILENKVRRGNVGGFDGGLSEMCVMPQDISMMGLTSSGGLPHAPSLPIHCFPAARPPLHGLKSAHSAFPFHSEKLSVDGSALSATASQNTQPSQVTSTINTAASMRLPVEGKQTISPGFTVPTDEMMTPVNVGEPMKDISHHSVENSSENSGELSEVSDTNSQSISSSVGYHEPLDPVYSDDNEKGYFVKEYSSDSKKHRTSSSGSSSDSLQREQSESDSSQSGSISGTMLQQTGIVSTTLKILMDSDSYKSGLQHLIPPILVPNYAEVLGHPALMMGDPEFIKHIQQLSHAMTVAFSEAKKNNKCPKDPNYTQIFNFSETSIKCLVKMAKNLEPFMKLDTDDQILLLKNSILEMMVLGSASSYDPQEKGRHVRDGNEIRLVSTKSVKSSRDGLILMCHYEMIILCVLSSTRRDLGLLSLLTILSLFSTKTNRVPLDLRNKAKVDLGYQLYWSVLQRYVHLKYGPEEETMVSNLGKASDIVRDFSETYIQSILKLPFGKINPLLLEIFDLPYT